MTVQVEVPPLRAFINRVREDERAFGFARKDSLLGLAEGLVTVRGFCWSDYREAIKILANYHLAKLANRCRPKRSLGLIELERAKPYVGRCQRCGRPIWTLESLSAGHGPVCRKKLALQKTEA